MFRAAKNGFLSSLGYRIYVFNRKTLRVAPIEITGMTGLCRNPRRKF
jgi:hypothetical protein